MNIWNKSVNVVLNCSC